MAEHDEIARKAAEAVVNRIGSSRFRRGGDQEWIRPMLSDDQIHALTTEYALVLAPFFAAARQEAREGALEEAVKAQCSFCQERIPFDGQHDHILPSGRLLLCRAPHLRALRPKLKEPA